MWITQISYNRSTQVTLNDPIMLSLHGKPTEGFQDHVNISTEKANEEFHKCVAKETTLGNRTDRIGYISNVYTVVAVLK